jgi:hypothetical protein
LKQSATWPAPHSPSNQIEKKANSRAKRVILNLLVKRVEPMSIVIIMAAVLEEELRERGIRGLTQLDRETIVHSMIERAASLEAKIKQRNLGSRLDDQN